MGINISEKVAKRLGKTILELGGNNAIIVDETVSLRSRIPRHRGLSGISSCQQR